MLARGVDHGGAEGGLEPVVALVIPLVDVVRVELVNERGGAALVSVRGRENVWTWCNPRTGV